MKSICIIANFCRPFDGRVDGRFLYLAEMFSKSDYDVELITSDFSHAVKKYKSEPVRTYKSKLTYVHEPSYTKNISIRRLYSHFVWGKNVRKYLNTINPPDCIYCAVPSLTAAYLATKFCRKNKLRLVIDIQDLWPEAFALAIKSKFLQKILFFPMRMIARKIYSNADSIIAVSETYCKRAIVDNPNNKKTLCVYLGNDGGVFDKARTTYRVDRQDDEIWLCYIGTLGFSYDIPCVIDALEKLKNKKFQKKVKFVVIGDGPLRKRFEEYAHKKSVYADFVGRKPYEEMVGLLCSCDIAINPIVKGSAGSVINKVGDYALSGLPVINTQECKEYRDLVETYKCGINCEVSNSEEVASAIELLANEKDLRKSMGEASRRLGCERFDRRNTYPLILSFLNKY